MISTYRMALLQTLDLVCILLALSVSGFLTVESDLSIFHDYTGATLFTIFFYMLFFYILDAYSVGNEDFKETIGRVLVACILGIISSATASYAFQHWRFDRETVALLFVLSLGLSLGWRWIYTDGETIPLCGGAYRADDHAGVFFAGMTYPRTKNYELTGFRVVYRNGR